MKIYNWIVCAYLCSIFAASAVGVVFQKSIQDYASEFMAAVNAAAQGRLFALRLPGADGQPLLFRLDERPAPGWPDMEPACYLGPVLTPPQLAADAWLPPLLEEVEALARRTGARWLRVPVATDADRLRYLQQRGYFPLRFAPDDRTLLHQRLLRTGAQTASAWLDELVTLEFLAHLPSPLPATVSSS